MIKDRVPDGASSDVDPFFDDETIIDLTEETEEDSLDLTDEVDDVFNTDENIIEAKEMPADGVDRDEDILDLTDLMDEPDEDDSDDDVLDLNEPLEAQDDTDQNEDILDLTDLMDEPDDDDTEDDVLDLNEPLDAQNDTDQEENILDLTDLTDAPDDDDADDDVLDLNEPLDAQNDTDRDEDILDLTDVQDTGANTSASAPSEQEDSGAAADESSLILDELLEETRKLESDELHVHGQDDLMSSLGIEIEPENETERVLEDAEQAEEEPDHAAPETAEDSQRPSVPVTVEPEQLEAAVEKVLLKLFSEKIERLMTDAVEKAVTNEIESLKEVLLKDLSDSDT